MFAKATSPEVVRCLCLRLRLVGADLELVEVRQLLPVVVLVLVGVVVVGAHNVVGDAGGRLLRPGGSEEVERGVSHSQRRRRHGHEAEGETKTQESSFLLVSVTHIYLHSFV